jgi:hypothetical protein
MPVTRVTVTSPWSTRADPVTVDRDNERPQRPRPAGETNRPPVVEMRDLGNMSDHRRTVRMSDELWLAFKDAVRFRGDGDASSILRSLAEDYVRDARIEAARMRRAQQRSEPRDGQQRQRQQRQRPGP